MEKEILKEPDYVEEILKLIKSDMQHSELGEKLEDYHEKDIAEAMEELTKKERLRLYQILGEERMSEIVAYSVRTAYHNCE